MTKKAKPTKSTKAKKLPSGILTLRIAPELHAELAALAASREPALSLRQEIEAALLAHAKRARASLKASEFFEKHGESPG